MYGGVVPAQMKQTLDVPFCCFYVDFLTLPFLHSDLGFKEI